MPARPAPVNHPLLPTADQLAPYLHRIDGKRWYTNRGVLLQELEQRLSALVGFDRQALVLTASGTAALEAAILATAGPADPRRPYALMPSYTFAATALAVQRCGYTPWFVDVDPLTMMVDAQALARHPQLGKTGVIVPVAAYGCRPDMAAYEDLQTRSGVPVVVDAAASFEQILAQPDLISDSVPMILSFHATKSFSTGEGGAVAWHDPEGQIKIAQAINFGFHNSRECRSPGLNGKLSEYHAAVGLAMLDGWADRQAAYGKVSQSYHQVAEECALRGDLLLGPDVSSAYALLRCQDAAQATAVSRRLSNHNIDWRRWYETGVHAMAYFANAPRDDLPGTRELGQILIGLPTAIDMDRAAIEPIMGVVAGFDGKSFNEARRLSKPARNHRPLTLMQARHLKNLLAARAPIPAAFRSYKAFTQQDDQLHLTTLPWCSIPEALAQSGQILQVLQEPGQNLRCSPPPITAPKGLSVRIPELQGPARPVLIGTLKQATVYGRSCVTRIGDQLVFDFDARELGAVSVDLAFDPVLFQYRTHHEAGKDQGDQLWFLDDQHPDRVMELDKAWSLLGINSISFGHWTVEGLLRFLQGRSLAELRDVPLLIDADMPAQHRQSLELLAQGALTLIEVPRHTRVKVKTLVMISNWFFMPHLMTQDQDVDINVCVFPAKQMAQCYQRAGQIFDQAAKANPSLLEIKAPSRHNPSRQSSGPNDSSPNSPALKAGDNLLWARDNSRHRGIANFAAVEQQVKAVGFKTVLPEQHSFAEQMAMIRGAKRVVVQNGSAMHALFFARPGTEVCFLSHPSLPFLSVYSQLLADLGLKMEVLCGPFTEKTYPYLDQSNYQIPEDLLAEKLANWARTET